MSSPTTSSRVPLKPQIIQRQYVDQRKLIQKLQSRYGTSRDGENNFRVELRLNRYTIMVPVWMETLSEHEINEFSIVV